MCGGTATPRGRAEQGGGLSPRVRGNLVILPRTPCRLGSIPACAGEPASRALSGSRRGVYPRVCGGTSGSLAAGQREVGLSPRVRGNRGRAVARWSRLRSIPACAGEPRAQRAPAPAHQVYPRVCGGTVRIASSHSSVSGLSPRVRGNRRRGRPSADRHGSIPACAGEPESARRRRLSRRVYPRVCGGTGITLSAELRVTGLSPRVRGNQAPTNRLPDG